VHTNPTLSPAAERHPVQSAQGLIEDDCLAKRLLAVGGQ
jgi:hypothetical protein